MEYGINSIEEDANKTILAALEDLDNTFFNEYLYSKDEEESNFTLNNDNNSDLIDLLLKLADTHLDNFEFEENPNSYVKDKVYNQVKLKVIKFFKKEKCTCCSSSQPCFMKISYEQFLARQIKFESLDKKMRDMVVKG